jgi:hypothetical protein
LKGNKGNSMGKGPFMFAFMGWLIRRIKARL